MIPLITAGSYLPLIKFIFDFLRIYNAFPRESLYFPTDNDIFDIYRRISISICLSLNEPLEHILRQSSRMDKAAYYSSSYRCISLIFIFFSKTLKWFSSKNSVKMFKDNSSFYKAFSKLSHYRYFCAIVS